MAKLPSSALPTSRRAGALAGALVLCQLADRFGRRNMLILILLSFGILLAFATLASNYPLLLIQRVCIGLPLGAAQPVIASLYVGLFPARVRGRLAGLVNAGFTSSMLGLSVGLALLGAEGAWRQLI